MTAAPQKTALPDPAAVRARLAAEGRPTDAPSRADAADAGGARSCLWDVDCSVNGRRWRLRDAPLETVQAIAAVGDVPEMVARLLAQRGVAPEDIGTYLAPTLKALMPDPSVLTDMDRAAARLADAIDRAEPVAIFADYDVDGATSAAVLARFWRALGQDARIYVPDRIDEGYGPNAPAMRMLAEDGARLVVTVDCGVTAFDALDAAAEAGLDVVVVDHHQAEDRLPRAHAVVNPNRKDDTSGLGHLAAVGVTFVTLVAVARDLRARGWFERTGVPSPDLRRWLDLVALGTVCDVVPLRGLNRAFVVQGLKVMARRETPGIDALMTVTALTDPPEPYHLGFVLGPRVNAGGRVGRAGIGAQLLAGEDRAEAARLAADLHGLNAERREIEQTVLDQALAQADAQIEAWPERPLVMVTGTGWHPGVIGIVASRLKDRMERPCFVLAEANGIAKGSGRSVAGADLGAAVLAAREAGLVVNGGGHAMAAGLTVAADGIDALEAFLGRALSEAVAQYRADPSTFVDAVVSLPGATRALFDVVQRAGPFGAGNPEPVIAMRDVVVQWVVQVGETHLRAVLATPEGTRLTAMAFRAWDTPLGEALRAAQGGCVHVLGRLRADNWKGRNDVQFHLEDVALPGAGGGLQMRGDDAPNHGLPPL